jgi:hypothetical protein
MKPMMIVTIVRKNSGFCRTKLIYCGISVTKNDVWEYTPSTDLWITRTSFEGTSRTDPVGFATENGRGFVVTGISSTLAFDDIWEFKPTQEFNEAD